MNFPLFKFDPNSNQYVPHFSFDDSRYEKREIKIASYNVLVGKKKKKFHFFYEKNIIQFFFFH